jgi:uncharacterized protein YdeI (YjbR/CyaY-like superfamily)
MRNDPRVDAYIAAAAAFAQPILRHLRTLVHATIPEAEEAIKWGMPCLTYRGKNLAGLAAFKAHASFGVHGDGTAVEGMGQFGKLKSLADLPDDEEIAARLLSAKDRIDRTGTALRKKPANARSPRPELPIPEEFAVVLAANPAARAALESFAPSHRREYVEWIVEAKQPETRAKRIAQAIGWLTDGKKRNWKYENC